MDSLALLARRRILCQLCALDGDAAEIVLAVGARVARVSRAWASAWRHVLASELLVVLARCTPRVALRTDYPFQLHRSSPRATHNPALPAASVACLVAAAHAAVRAADTPLGVAPAVFALRNESVSQLARTDGGRARLVAAVRAPRGGAVAHELVARTALLTLRRCLLARADWHFAGKLSETGVASAADALLHFWPHEHATADVVARLTDAQCIELARACEQRLAVDRRWRNAATTLQIVRAPPIAAGADKAARRALRAIATTLRDACGAAHGAAVTLYEPHALPLHCARDGAYYTCSTPCASVKVCGKRALGHLLRDTLCATRYAQRVVLCRFDADGCIEWMPAAFCVLRPGATHSQIADALTYAARRGAMRDAAVLCRTLRARAIDALVRAHTTKLHAFCTLCAQRAQRHCAALVCASASPQCPGVPEPSTPERELHRLRRLARHARLPAK